MIPQSLRDQEVEAIIAHIREQRRDLFTAKASDIFDIVLRELEQRAWRKSPGEVLAGTVLNTHILNTFYRYLTDKARAYYEVRVSNVTPETRFLGMVVHNAPTDSSWELHVARFAALFSDCVEHDLFVNGVLTSAFALDVLPVCVICGKLYGEYRPHQTADQAHTRCLVQAACKFTTESEAGQNLPRPFVSRTMLMVYPESKHTREDLNAFVHQCLKKRSAQRYGCAFIEEGGLPTLSMYPTPWENTENAV